MDWTSEARQKWLKAYFSKTTTSDFINRDTSRVWNTQSNPESQGSRKRKTKTQHIDVFTKKKKRK